MSETTNKDAQDASSLLGSDGVNIEPFEFGSENVAEAAPVNSKANDPDWSPEELAKAKANRYKEDDPKGYSPGEFNRRGELFTVIKEKNDHIEAMVRNMNHKLEAAERRGYEQALVELNSRRDAAIDLGDRAAVHALDREADALRNSYQQSIAPIPSHDIERSNYVEQNRQWLSDPDMYSVAVGFEQRLMSQRATLGLPPLSAREQGAAIREHVMKSFPHKFENRASSAPPLVEGSSGGRVDKEASRRGEATVHDLTPQQREIYSRMKRDLEPDLTPQEYINRMSPDYVPNYNK